MCCPETKMRSIWLVTFRRPRTVKEDPPILEMHTFQSWKQALNMEPEQLLERFIKNGLVELSLSETLKHLTSQTLRNTLKEEDIDATGSSEDLIERIIENQHKLDLNNIYSLVPKKYLITKKGEDCCDQYSKDEEDSYYRSLYKMYNVDHNKSDSNSNYNSGNKVGELLKQTAPPFLIERVYEKALELPGEVITRVNKLINSRHTPDFTMVPLPGGRFRMGSTSINYEQPTHYVAIKPFEMGSCQVTQELWNAVMENNPSKFKGLKLPVENVSWDEVILFIAKLNKIKGENYRLPTEAEWEYACRGGTTTEYCFGDANSQLDDYAWYSKNAESTTHPVGEKKPNQFGLYDMHGNVWEWCQDHWHENYNGAPDDGSAWLGSDMAANRVRRGGSWGTNAVLCRSANRGRVAPGIRSDGLGFRLSRTLP